MEEGRSSAEPSDPGSLASCFPSGFTRTRAELEGWRAGDPAAFGSLWARYRPALEVLIARQVAALAGPTLRSRIESEDILQDTMTVVLRKLADFEYLGPGSLYGWMQSVATHQVRDRLDFLTAQKRDAGREQPLCDGEMGFFEPRAPGRCPGTEAASNEEQDRVRQVVAALPEREHRIVMLRYFFGAEWVEIARELGAVSAEAVRKEHMRILPRLARSMADIR